MTQNTAPERQPALPSVQAVGASQVAQEPLSATPELPSPDSESSFKITKFRSLRLKILSIALISSVALMLYVSLVSGAAQNNTRKLQEIYEVKYPIQLLLQSSKRSLTLINQEFQEAIVTGNEELVLSAEPTANEFRQNIEGVIKLNPSHKEELELILDQFETFYANAYSYAQERINGVDDKLKNFERSKENRANYRAVASSVQDFQQGHLDLFAKTVSDTSARAKDAVVIGLWTSLATASLVLILALVIARSILRRVHAIVSSLKRIAQEDGSMQVRIRLDGNDEMTELAHWFNTFIEKLERVTLESHAEIKRIAYTDTLSGLPNRRKLIENISSAMEIIADPKEQLAVLFLDLDNFKPINDQFGHEAGDLLIQQASNRLQTIVDEINQESDRPQNPVKQASAGRLGGDEFMVIVPSVPSHEQIKAIAEHIRSALLEPFALNGVNAQIGVSIGISCYPADASTKEHLIDCADMAMYQAKSAGKNAYSFYTSEMAASLDHSLRVEAALKNSMSNNELFLEYQPKFDLTTGEYIGCEALLRWHNKELGSIRPMEFIHLAEKTNVIHAIEEWVLQDTCKQIADWLDRGIDPGRVAINVSAKQIQKPNLLETITPLIDQYNIPYECLEFEITESSTLDNMDMVVDNVQKLRNLNIQVCMDDFGSGHSSLQLLINCNIDTVKIDRALIQKLCTNERYESIVRSIISLTSTLDIKCVAQGIEDFEQLHMLRNFDCQSGQGHYFSFPMLPAALEEHMFESKSNQRQVAQR